MKILLLVYAILIVAAIAASNLGVALMSAVCAVFFYWADKKMGAIPKPPTVPKSTLEVLDEYGCECCNPNSPRQISFSD